MFNKLIVGSGMVLMASLPQMAFGAPILVEIREDFSDNVSVFVNSILVKGPVKETAGVVQFVVDDGVANPAGSPTFQQNLTEVPPGEPPETFQAVSDALKYIETTGTSAVTYQFFSDPFTLQACTAPACTQLPDITEKAGPIQLTSVFKGGTTELQTIFVTSDPVPEPATLSLLSVSLLSAGLMASIMRRRHP